MSLKMYFSQGSILSYTKLNKRLVGFSISTNPKWDLVPEYVIAILLKCMLANLDSTVFTQIENDFKVKMSPQ